MGSTIRMTKENGDTIAWADYDAWGKPRSPVDFDMNLAGVDNAVSFTSYTYDTVLDLYFAQARFYDANTRRFISVDPIKDGINWYAYCGNSPVVFVDPSGLVVRNIRDFVSDNNGVTIWDEKEGIAIFEVNDRKLASLANGTNNTFEMKITPGNGRLRAEEADLLAYFYQDEYNNGVYTTQNLAAKDWATNNYEESLYIRFELGALVYSFESSGTTYFSYTNSVVGDAHSVQPFDMRGDVPGHGTVVSGLHTHPNSNNFSSGDKNWAQHNDIGIYVITPNRNLQLYSKNNGTYVTTIVVRNLQTKPLTESQKAKLKQMYQSQWANHLTTNCNFNCADMTWPTP